MELLLKKLIQNLDSSGCQVVTIQYVEIDGKENTVGYPHSCYYANSEQGKKDIQEREPENISSAALAMWKQ